MLVESKNKLIKYLPLVPGVAYSLFFLIFTFVDLVYLSFKDGIRSFEHVFSDEVFYISIPITIRFSVISTIGVILFGLVTALLLNRTTKHIRVWRTVLFLPWVTPFVAMGLTWKWLIHEEYGVYAHFLRSLQLPGWIIPSLSNPSTALSAVILAYLWFQIPFAMIILLAALQDIPLELYETAEVDGGTKIQKFSYITFPYLINHMVTIGLVTFIWATNSFALVYTMTRGGPVSSTTLISVYAFQQAFDYFDYGRGAVAVLLQFIVMFLILIPLYKLFYKPERVEL